MVTQSRTLDWTSADCQLIWQSPATHRKPENIYIRLWGLIQTINTTDEQYLEQLHDCKNENKRRIITEHLDAKRQYFNHPEFPLIAFHPTKVSYHKIALKKGEIIPVTIVFGGEHRHLAQQWLEWFAVRLTLENTGFSLANKPTLKLHQITLPSLTANKLSKCQALNEQVRQHINVQPEHIPASSNTSLDQSQDANTDSNALSSPQQPTDNPASESTELTVIEQSHGELTILIDTPANFELNKTQQKQVANFSESDTLKYALIHNSKKRLCQWFPEQMRVIEQWFKYWAPLLLASPMSLYQLHQRHKIKSVSKSTKGACKTQFHKGHAGWLTFKGAWLEAGELFTVLSSIHLLGQRMHINGLGYFLTQQQLEHSAPTLWQRHLTDKHKIEQAINEVLERHELEPVVDDSGRIMQVDALTELIYTQLSTGVYQPKPTRAMFVPKPKGGKRCIEELDQVDMMVHRLVFNAINKMIESYQSPLSLGYRKGYSRQMARDNVQSLIDSGFGWVIEADIEAFFDNVPFDRMWQRLSTILPKREQQVIMLIKQLMQVSYTVSNASGTVVKEYSRSKGLMQGSPLSPVLANLYLAMLDKQINAEHFAFVRYADDVLMFCRSAADAHTTLEWLDQHLSELGLNLSLAKTAITAVNNDFEFLGYRFDKEGSDDKSIVPVLRQRKPIMITGSRKYLGVNGSALEVRQKQPRKQPGKSLSTSPLSNQLIQVIPLRRISQLVVMGNHSLSSPLLTACAKHHISVHLVNQWGFQVGTFKPSHAEYYAVSAQQYQRHQQLKPSERMAIAADLVLAKINNYQTWIINSYRKGDAQVNKQLDQIAQQASSATTIEALMGYEGQAAKICFQRLQSVMIGDQQAAFSSKRRSRGGPDRLNSMLNFGYYWLFTRISGLLHSHGLNPYLSFLHEPEQNYETLVYDIMELFRVQVDKTVLRLINRKQIQADSFHLDAKKGWKLNNDALHLLSNQLQSTLASKINQTFLEDIILIQVRTLLHWATQQQSLVWFYWYADKDNVQFSLPDESPQTLVIDNLESH